MNASRLAHGLLALLFSAGGFAWAASATPKGDPLATIDLHRNAIIADIVEGFAGDRTALAKRLARLRADHLLSASLASSRESLETILHDAEKSRDKEVSHADAKALGSPTSDLVYTPLTPCRLIDTRGFGAPIQGGIFAPNERRAYVPNGRCNLPTTGVASMLISFTTQNLTPASGGYLAILAPLAPVTASVDIFNVGSEWSASNTAVGTGSAAQFDVFVAQANAHVVVDILGYFAPPQGVTGGGVTAVNASAPLASSGGSTPTISLTGAIPIANGGTGQSTLATNGIVYGQGTAAVGTAVGGAGQVLAGTAGAPAWTASPSLDGNLTLVPSSSSAGNILKAGSRFIHNFGIDNTFIGVNAGNFATTGSGNTGSGGFALQNNTTGNQNTATGYNALQFNTSGEVNTASGAYALQKNTTGSQNTATGNSALSSNTAGGDNTASGFGALAFNTTGNKNTASGYYALLNNTTGSLNTASGSQALSFNTTGSNNTASGWAALGQNTSGGNNTASGYSALFSNASGAHNTATGHSALMMNTFGLNNTATGKDALLNNTSNNNTATGVAALQSNSIGTDNTAHGTSALQNNTTGNNNIGLGRVAGINLTTGNFNIAIGNAGVAAEGNTIRIGDANHSRTFVGGVRGVTTALAAIPVFIDTNGQLGTASSSRRFKDDIADMGNASSVLAQLRPVTFYYKAHTASGQAATQYGLIAEEVAQAAPGLVARSADGSIETVNYHFLAPMLLNEYQRQKHSIAIQEARIGALEGELAAIKRALLP